MLTYSIFKGKIDGKTIYDFSNKLDYTLNQQDRIKLVNNILNTQTVGENTKLPDAYFEEYFEQRDLVNGIDTSHIKLCATTKDNLSSSNNVCKELEKMADYILFAPDGERINKKMKYNFYTEEDYNRKLKKEKSLIEQANNYVNENNIKDCTEDEAIDFLINSGKNYKKSIKQKITMKDLNDKELYCLRDYEKLLIWLKQQLHNENKKDAKEHDSKRRFFYGNQIGEIKKEQKLCKDMIKRTIYFKQPLSDSTVIDYEQFDFFDKEHVMALLKINPRTDLTSDLACLTQDLNNLLKKCNLNTNELKVLDMWRIEDSTQESIASYLKITQQLVSAMLNRICWKVINQYEKEYEDWYYLNVVKGKYKKCRCCNEVKLTNKFGKDERNKDSLKSYCRECEKQLK
jgi:hypothetical protein